MHRLVARALVAALLAACGQGGATDPAPPPTPRTLDAWPSSHVVRRFVPAPRGAIVDRHQLPLAQTFGATRTYPQGALAAHVVGYLAPMTADDLTKLPDLPADTQIGRVGIERAWENYLRGKPGIVSERIDDQGRVVGSDDRIDAVPGDTVVLTLDVELQRVVEGAIARFPTAAAVVIEAATGRILAMASTPGFDPGAPAASVDAPGKPFLDRAMVAARPGATYFVAKLAALEDGVPADGQAAERVGLDRMAEVAAAFGFGAISGIGLERDEPGRIPTRGWYEMRGTYRPALTKQAGAGLGDVEVTPLQLAVAYAALATGVRYQPQLVDRAMSGTRTIVTYAPTAAAVTLPDPAILDRVRTDMLVGTNALAGVAATTDRGHAAFGGWAPVDQPRLAIAVMLEGTVDDAGRVAETIVAHAP